MSTATADVALIVYFLSYASMLFYQVGPVRALVQHHDLELQASKVKII